LPPPLAGKDAGATSLAVALKWKGYEMAQAHLLKAGLRSTAMAGEARSASRTASCDNFPGLRPANRQRTLDHNFRHLARLLMGVCSLAAFEVASTAADFSVSGTFKVQHLVALGNLPAEKSGWFTVSSKGCTWKIRSYPGDGQVDFAEDMYDGKYVYTLQSFESWARAREAKGLKAGANLGEGIVTPSFFPQNSAEINRVLWLVFGLGCYLTTNTTFRLPPIVTPSSRHAYLYGFDQKAVWKLSGSEPTLPETVVIFDDGLVRRWQDEDTGYLLGPPQQVRRMPPYDKGYTNAILVAEGSHSAAPGGNFSRRASFRIYGPKRGGTEASDLRLLRTYALETTNCSRDVPTLEKPSVAGPILVTDRRFQSDKNPVFQAAYLFTNAWLSDEAVRQRPEFPQAAAYQKVQKQAAAPLPSSTSSVRRKLVLFSIFVLGIAILVVLVQRSQQVHEP